MISETIIANLRAIIREQEIRITDLLLNNHDLQDRIYELEEGQKEE